MNSLKMRRSILIDLATLGIGIGIAVILEMSGVLDAGLLAIKSLRPLDSFVTGLFFTSVLTTGSAIAAFGEIARHGESIWLMAIIGGFGAMLSDLLLIKLFREHLTKDFNSVFGSRMRSNILMRSKTVRVLCFLLGGVIIASPLPDELGLALMGVSHFSKRALMPILFFCNTMGIALIGAVAKAI